MQEGILLSLSSSFPLGRGKRERNNLTGISCFDLRECEEMASSNKHRFSLKLDPVTNSSALELQIWYVSRATPLRFLCTAQINELGFVKKGNDSLGKNRQHLKELVNTAINFRTRILCSVLA